MRCEYKYQISRRDDEIVVEYHVSKEQRRNMIFRLQPFGILPILFITSSLVGKVVKTTIFSSLLVLNKIGKYRI